jgi:aspartate kinase
MQIHKFGGASVKDADGVKNLAKVLQTTGTKNKLLVVSAMGKTTNALENILAAYFSKSPDLKTLIFELKNSHIETAKGLFEHENHLVFGKISKQFEELEAFLERNKSPNYDYVYDQTVSFGELLSTVIVSEYLNFMGTENQWLDVRTLIKTNDTYREGDVDWETTQANIAAGIDPNKLIVTQGFIASDENNFTTTLGREGSDYTAAIFAYCLNAESLSIWKDVEGVLNGDPKTFENTRLLEQISYTEAIELAFYGASVIHPKTLQPLQKKEIPLYVKSFLQPEKPGTCVSRGKKIQPEIPCYILKKNLWLISLSSLDFSFIVEENISEIFGLFHEYQIKVDLIQNSAISFSICADNKFNTIQKLLTRLKAKYKVKFHENVSLYTIRHFTEKAIAEMEKGKEVLLNQRTRETVQFIAKD